MMNTLILIFKSFLSNFIYQIYIAVVCNSVRYYSRKYIFHKQRKCSEKKFVKYLIFGWASKENRILPTVSILQKLNHGSVTRKSFFIILAPIFVRIQFFFAFLIRIWISWKIYFICIFIIYQSLGVFYLCFVLKGIATKFSFKEDFSIY